MDTTRRTFLKTSAKTLAAASLLPTSPLILPESIRKHPPSDQVNLGLIGARNRGWHVLAQHLKIPGVKCLALSDIDKNVLQDKARELQEADQPLPSLHGDYRELLERKDIDAVIISTPDHWHCLPTIHACEAGKDVYVEKPMANSIGECQLMVEAGKYYNRIIQVGQQQRSSEVWGGAMDYLKSGKLGTLRRANIWANFNYGLGPMKQANEAVPAGVDYNSWLGPAPERPFNPARFHSSWRFFWDYGGGLMTDWGVHLIDMALWAKDITSPPEVVLASGSQLDRPDRMRETHDTLTALYEVGDYLIQWEHNAGLQRGPYDRLYGVAFVCDNGTLVADRSKWEVYPEWDNEAKAPKVAEVPPQKGESGHSRHPVDFIVAIKDRTRPSCPAEIGANVAFYAHMANIALRTGAQRLAWLPDKQRFDNKDANRMIMPEYRKPWSLPKVG